MKAFDRPNPKKRPIGYWIKTIDRALDSLIDDTHRDVGLDRQGWQLLATVCALDGDIDLARMTAEMDPVLNMDEVSSKLVDLVQMGLLCRTGDAFKISENGRKIHKQLAERQNRIRQRAMNGISSAEYDHVIEVLAKIAENLDTSSGVEAAC